MLNTAGRLACGTTANLFLVHDGTLLTPSLEEGALPGITRALVLELAPGLGIVARETPLEPALLAQAQEAFLTSSLRLLTPLASIEGRPLARTWQARASAHGSPAQGRKPLKQEGSPAR